MGLRLNVTLCSAFRNASSYIDRYLNQVIALDLALLGRGDTFSCIWGEGDSTDDTLHALMFYNNIRCTIVDVTHNGPLFGSIVHPQRFKQLAGVCNKIWEKIPEDADVVIWAESDLQWDAATMLRLIDDLAFAPCIAPMIMEKSTGGWYDVWAYRRNGVHFTKQAPYHPDIEYSVTLGQLLQLDSAGSCLVMNGELARRLTWPEESVIVGICAGVYEHGGSVHLDPTVTVKHA